MRKNSLLTASLLITLLMTLAMGSGINAGASPGVVPLAPAAGSLNVNLDQCANDTTPCTWQNGDLNGNNSAYAEGDVVPFRLAIEGRAAFSPDALTGMEANLRFAGPETMETKIFGRLSAWQNWIFQRPNAVGEKGALTSYGSQARPEFDFRRT